MPEVLDQFRMFLLGNGNTSDKGLQHMFRAEIGKQIIVLFYKIAIVLLDLWLRTMDRLARSKAVVGFLNSSTLQKKKKKKKRNPSIGKIYG